MPRRKFLKAAPVAAYAMTQIAKGATLKTPASAERIKIEPFDYRGVTAPREPMAKAISGGARFLFRRVRRRHPVRLSARRRICPRRARPLGGWCARNSNTVFGQWLSGMSRFSCAINDAAHARQSRSPVHRMVEDREARRRLRHEALSLRETRVRPGGHAIVSGLPGHDGDAGEGDGLGVEEFRSHPRAGRAASPGKCIPAGRSNGTPSAKIFFARINSPAMRSSKSSPKCGFITTYWNKFADTADPGRCVGRSRLQPRQHVQQRGDGVCGHGR